MLTMPRMLTQGGRTKTTEEGAIPQATSWTTVAAILGTVAAIILGVWAVTEDLFTRIGKLEGQIEQLDPDSIRRSVDQAAGQLKTAQDAIQNSQEAVGSELENQLERARAVISEATDAKIDSRIAGLEKRLLERLARGDAPTGPEHRRWCDMANWRKPNLWYSSSSDIELTVQIRQGARQPLASHHCDALVVLSVPNSRFNIAVAGAIDPPYEHGDAHLCSVTGVTIPSGTGYFVARTEGAIVTEWSELRPSCDP